MERELTQERLMEPCGFYSGDKKSEEGSHHHIPLETVETLKMPGEEQAQAREIPAGNGKNPSQGECLCSGTGPREVVVGSPSWRSLRSWLDMAWQCSQPCLEKKASPEEQRTLEVLPTCLL